MSRKNDQVLTQSGGAFGTRRERDIKKNSSNILVSVAVKVKWVVVYVLLLVTIGGSMIWHSRHLPKEVRESSLVNLVHEW